MSAPNSALRIRLSQNALFDAERRRATPEQAERMYRLHIGASPADMTVLRRPALGRECSPEALQGAATGLSRMLRGEVGQGAAGLAAPQIGRTVPMFGMRVETEAWHLWYFDPAVPEHGVTVEGEILRDIEGCLSFPIDYDPELRLRIETDLAFAEALKVPRHSIATVTGIKVALGPEGGPGDAQEANPDVFQEVTATSVPWFKDALAHPRIYTQTVRYSGFLARVAQHEYAHLKGQLYIDHLPRYYRDRIVNKGRY